jgi:hypothetical protein
MAHPMCESESDISWSFTVPTTSDAGLLPFRELDNVMADAVLSGGRR